MSMEQAADTAEATAVDHYFSSAENIFVQSAYGHQETNTDNCFVMRSRSSKGGAVTQLQLQYCVGLFNRGHI